MCNMQLFGSMHDALLEYLLDTTSDKIEKCLQSGCVVQRRVGNLQAKLGGGEGGGGEGGGGEGGGRGRGEEGICIKDTPRQNLVQPSE